MKILLTRKWPVAVEQAFRDEFDVTVNENDEPLDAGALIAATRAYDVVCPTVSDFLPAAMFDGPGLRTRLIANYGAGYEHIDVARCCQNDIVVTNTPDILTQATAELAILLMLMIARRAGEGERELRAGQWQGWRPMHMHGRQLSGKTLGLIGFGRIAQATATLAQGLGMNIVYHSRNSKGTAEHYCATIAELLQTSDFVSLHCPGGAATENLIDAQALAFMKPTAFLINTARGSVIDEAALADALARGHIASAALDVFRNEPDISATLLNAPNLVMLPHLGSATAETREAMGMRVLANVRAFAERREPCDRVV